MKNNKCYCITTGLENHIINDEKELKPLIQKLLKQHKQEEVICYEMNQILIRELF